MVILKLIYMIVIFYYWHTANKECKNKYEKAVLLFLSGILMSVLN
jgi:hypothetical protein